MEGSHPAAPAEPGTLKASLVATPGPVPARGRVRCSGGEGGGGGTGGPGGAAWWGDRALGLSVGGSGTASVKWGEVGDFRGRPQAEAF